MVEDLSETGKDAVSWNLSSRVIFLIGQHLQEASFNFSKNNQQAGFRSYNEIAVLIDTDLDKDEKKILHSLSKRINSLYGKWYRLARADDDGKLEKKDRRKLLFYRGRHHILVEEYRKFLLDLLDKYGYLIARAKDASKMFS